MWAPWLLCQVRNGVLWVEGLILTSCFFCGAPYSENEANIEDDGCQGKADRMAGTGKKDLTQLKENNNGLKPEKDFRGDS
jgi:hypothetical protein